MTKEIDVGMKCIKYMLFVANFMFVMIGFLLISIGSTIKAIYGDFEVFMAQHYFSPAVLAIAIGVIIFFVALFGCVGAIKESTCLINMFGVFMGFLLVLELSAAIAAYAMRGQIEDTIRQKMEQSIGEYYHDDYDKGIWDFTQQRLYCCGVDNYHDWESYVMTAADIEEMTTTPKDSSDGSSSSAAASSSSSSPFSLWEGPQSCCHPRDVHNHQCVKQYVFREGCLDSLSYIVSESALLLGCGALAVAFIQLLGVVFACMLAKAVRRLKTQELLDREQDRQTTYEQLARGKEENQTPVLYTPTFSEA
jgi:CD63 antigen